jgi:hypothetical protein
MTDRKERFLISIFLMAILLASPASLVATAAGSHTVTVAPTGNTITGDTANIQAAFNSCVAYGPHCTVQLEKGTYYTAQIAVVGFQGSFVGMGQGVTIIQALPNLSPPNSADNIPCSGYKTGTCSGTGRELGTPFLAALPGPTNPWPALFTFVDGSFSVSGMTLTIPSTTPVYPGWYWYDTPTPYTSLIAAIEITGSQAHATFDHVTVLGTSGDAAGPNTYNLWNGINFEGVLLPSGWTNPLAQAIPLSGSYTVTNSVFNYVESGPWMDTLIGATVKVCDNTITHSYGSTGFYDAYNSNLTYCDNQISNVQTFTGIWAAEGIYEFGTLPSTVYITGNQIQVGQGANGILLADYNTVPTLNAVVSGNTIQTDTSCGCYDPTNPSGYSVIISSDLKSSVVTFNTINGAGAAGIYISGGPGQVAGNVVSAANTGIQVDVANGVNVAANLIKNSVQWGIAVTDGSGNNRIIGNFVHESGAFDLYWDGSGTGNVWHANLCQTSSPSGLC